MPPTKKFILFFWGSVKKLDIFGSVEFKDIIDFMQWNGYEVQT